MTFDWHRRFHADTIEIAASLSLEDTGALNIIVDHIYLHGRPLADDAVRMAGLLKVDGRKWRAIRRRLLRVSVLIVADGYLDEARAREARLYREATSIARRAAGYRGGIARTSTKHLPDILPTSPEHRRVILGKTNDLAEAKP